MAQQPSSPAVPISSPRRGQAGPPPPLISLPSFASNHQYFLHGGGGKEDSLPSQLHSSLNSESTRRSRRSRKTSFRFSECDGDEDLPQFQGPRRVQYFAALAANMGALALGTVLSWSAVALPDLRKDPRFTATLTPTVETWIGSIITLGAVAAGPASGFGIETLGRRKSMLLLTGPFLLGWLLIYFAYNVNMILAGRFVTGFCSGIFG
ncbi:Facilitated trehalose transporter Tret1 [Folsomia candida]|uniref:Facilitated trehalose transporter Tret1 n=1 Tax=Folsomia candida TaxID=158441 RepID=A0A226DMQ4_FOLCA|nr:Facilitated trehalose transporter Tret1 [Folsomia candida]